ncbi:hypothetical protein Tco_1132097 [Tanacetum coccineum]|uniref:Uncharacterized protein n=1 Tax=Tanacetum coccineum TaxID=301880 RepID=A0ABQ5JAY1_9ASTR
MHTSKDDYLINTLRFVFAKEATQIYGVVLPESLTSPEIKETKAYKTYLGFDTRATPPKKVRKFKKPASPQLSIVPVSPEEPTGKSKRVKRPTKKSTNAPARDVVIRETPEMPLSKKKEKMTGNDEYDTNNKQDSSGEDKIEEVIGDDEEEVKDEFVKTPSNDFNDEDETKISNKVKGDEDEEMDYTTSQLYDDVDIRLNKPVQADDETVQKEGTDAELTNIQPGNENPETSQVIEDAHVTLSIVPHKTEVPVTSSSHSSDLASKFLNFSDIPHTDANIISLMDVHVHHEVPSQQTPTFLIVPVSVITDSSPVYWTVIPQSLPSFTPPPQQSTSTPPPITKVTNPQSALPDFASVFQFNNRVTTLEKDVSELKKDDPLKTQVTSLVDEHLDVRLGATRDEFMNYLSASITARITEQVKNQLPQILPKEVSNFAPPVIQSMVTESLEHEVLATESSQPQSSYEAVASLTKFELKKILINKMDKSKSYLAAPEHKECYDGLIKSYDLDKSIFSTYDKVYSFKRSRKDKDKDEDPSVGSNRGLKKRKTSKDAEPTKEEPEFEVAVSDMPQDQEGNLGNDDEPMKETISKHDWFTKPTQPQEPTDPDSNDGKTP